MSVRSLRSPRSSIRREEESEDDDDFGIYFEAMPAKEGEKAEGKQDGKGKAKENALTSNSRTRISGSLNKRAKCEPKFAGTDIALSGSVASWSHFSVFYCTTVIPASTIPQSPCVLYTNCLCKRQSVLCAQHVLSLFLYETPLAPQRSALHYSNS